MTFETSDTDEQYTEHVKSVHEGTHTVLATCPGCGYSGWISVDAVETHTGTNGICGNCSTEVPILK